MNQDERFVLDTNVIVSALLFSDSAPGQAFFRALKRGRILLSWVVLRELSDVLSRDKFNPYLLPEERQRFLGSLLREASLIDVTDELRVCRDPKDDKFLDLATAGKAACIVTGDKDLLALHPFREIPIVTPAQFLERWPD
jgi:putative PIN family toxin of toxin-antitoxin system